MSRSFVPIGLLAAATLGLVAHRGGAQPIVRVHSESRIELRAESRGATLHVSGTLRDDLGSPLSGRHVDLRLIEPNLHTSTTRAFTHGDGRFEAQLRPSAEVGDRRLEAAFDGDATHEGIRVERPIGAALQDVQLDVAIEGGARLDLDVPTHPLEVTARTSGPSPPLHLSVVDELDRPIADGVTDVHGRATLVLRSDILGAPGPGRITVRSAPDATHPEAQTEVPVLRVRQSELSLSADPSFARPGRPVHLSGVLRDRRGPLAHRTVGLFHGETHLGSVATDDRGRFDLTWEPPATLAGHYPIVARFESSSPGRLEAESRPVDLHLEARALPRGAWLLLPVLVCAVGLVIWARRSRPVARRARRAPPPSPPVGVIPGPTPRGRAIDTRIAGRVVDHRDDTPVAGAVVHLTAPGGASFHLTTDARGLFSSPSLAQGTWSIEIEAEGYQPAEAVAIVPHRGEWREVTIHLRSQRARALAAFRRVVLPWLPNEATWSLATNREIVRTLPTETRRDVAELEARVEIAYYGPDTPKPEEVDAIEAQAEPARDDRRAPRPAR